jgi:hypothetical protein
MRRTVTLEPDLAKKLQAFALLPHPSGFRPGIDQSKLNQLYDQLEVEDFLAKGQR